MFGPQARESHVWEQLNVAHALSVAQQSLAATSNVAYAHNVATTNGMGVGGPTIVALAVLTVKASGIFDYSVVAQMSAAAATETVVWTVTGQTGTGTPTFTGNTAAGVGCQNATGAAGTPIAITAGGGGEFTLHSSAKVIGTAATGDQFSASGTLSNDAVSATAITPFARGNNVFLILKVTEGVNHPVVWSLSLRERASQ